MSIWKLYRRMMQSNVSTKLRPQRTKRGQEILQRKCLGLATVLGAMTYTLQGAQAASNVINPSFHGGCNDIFGYNWWNMGSPCTEDTSSVDVIQATAGPIPLSVNAQWTKNFDPVTTTFKWARSTVIDQLEGAVYIQFSREASPGGQIGATLKSGKLVKVDADSGTTLAEEVGTGHENRWAAYVHDNHVYTVYSHYMVHQDVNGPGFSTHAPEGGRAGHWLYKLKKSDLSIVSQREVSCDFGIFKTAEGFAKCADTSNNSDEDEVAKYLDGVQASTQLNGVLGATMMENDQRCGPNEMRIFLGISGYPYATIISAEPQNRALGLHNFHHNGKLMAFCTGSLKPAWRDPYRNGYAVPNPAFSEARWQWGHGGSARRDELIGDAISSDHLKPGNTFTGAMTTLDCDNMPVGTRRLLPKHYRVCASRLSVNSTDAGVGDLFKDAASTATFELSAVEEAGSCNCVDATDACLEMRPYKALYGSWNKNSVLVRVDAEGTTLEDAADGLLVTEVDRLTMQTCYVTFSFYLASFFKWNNDVACVDWDVDTGPERQLDDTTVLIAPMVQNPVYVNVTTPPDPSNMVPVCDAVPVTVEYNYIDVEPFSPTIKVLREEGDIIENHDMRVSLNNFGGSFWFRVANDGTTVCSPTGNGAGESMDKYSQTSEVQLLMVANDQRVAAALSAWVENKGNPSLLAEYAAAIDERESLSKSKDFYRSLLSPADSANANSAIHCASVEDGSPSYVTAVVGPDTWLLELGLNGLFGPSNFNLFPEKFDNIAEAIGQYSYVDAETNNVLMIPGLDGKAELLVGASKGGAVFTIDADTQKLVHLHAVGLQPSTAKGGDATMNFGGMCYPGSGDIVVFSTSAAASQTYGNGGFLVLLSDPAKEPVHFPLGTGGLVGYNFRTGKNDWAVRRSSGLATGIQCGRGLAFSLDQADGVVRAVVVATGLVAFDIPVPECINNLYNCAEVAIHGEFAYMSTYKSLTKYQLGYQQVGLTVSLPEPPLIDEPSGGGWDQDAAEEYLNAHFVSKRSTTTLPPAELRGLGKTVIRDPTDVPAPINVRYSPQLNSKGGIQYFTGSNSDLAVPCVSDFDTSTWTMKGDAYAFPEDCPYPLPKSFENNPDAIRALPRRQAPITHKIVLTTPEVTAEIEPGHTYDFMTYNGTVPGPPLRVRVGDWIDLTLVNPATSIHEHSVDFHAMAGPGGGAASLRASPGEQARNVWKATYPGMFIYHCASGWVSDHITRGMYGAIIVEDLEGFPYSDMDVFLGQGELYLQNPLTRNARVGFGVAPPNIHNDHDSVKERLEASEAVMFNGAPFALVHNPIRVPVGAVVRGFMVVGGPNAMASFHLIGDHWDRVWLHGDFSSEPQQNVQTTVVPPGGCSVVDWRHDEPGRFVFVDHALTRTFVKGALGFIMACAEGDELCLAGGEGGYSGLGGKYACNGERYGDGGSGGVAGVDFLAGNDDCVMCPWSREPILNATESDAQLEEILQYLSTQKSCTDAPGDGGFPSAALSAGSAVSQGAAERAAGNEMAYRAKKFPNTTRWSLDSSLVNVDSYEGNNDEIVTASPTVAPGTGTGTGGCEKQLAAVTFGYDLQSDGSGTGTLTVASAEMSDGGTGLDGYMSLGLSGDPNLRTMIGGHVAVFSVTTSGEGALSVTAGSFEIVSKSGVVFEAEDGEATAFTVSVSAYSQTAVSESGSVVTVEFSISGGDWAVPVSGNSVQMIWAYGRNSNGEPGIHTQRDGMLFRPAAIGCDMIA